MASFTDLPSLGDLVSTIGSRSFNRAFYDVFRNVFEVDECTVFSFESEDRPEKVLVEGISDRRREVASSLANDYVAGGYMSDPNVRDKPESGGAYALDPATIGAGSYRSHFYDAPSVGHELFMLKSHDAITYYTSLYRCKDAPGFTTADVNVAKDLAGFMVRSLHRHRQLVRRPRAEIEKCTRDDSWYMGALAHLNEVLLAAPCRLSPREAEVCAGIVLGYSSEAISLRCSIAQNTVATHRKRAYAKLGISSQNELFATYFETVRFVDNWPIN